MAAVLGLSPWQNAYDIWLEKTGQLNDRKEESYMGAGSMFENGVLDWAAKVELGELVRNVTVKAVGFPVVSNVDAIRMANKFPVEAKVYGLFGPLLGGWGEAGSDMVPDYIIIQTHVHMLCTDKPTCYVPTFLGGRGFVMYYIDRDQEIIDAICDKSIEFWDEYVVKKTPPPDIMPTLPVIKRMRREPEKIVDIPEAAVINYLNAVEAEKQTKEIKELAKTEMLTHLGNAEAGRYGNEGMMITYFESIRHLIDGERLKMERPEIAAEFEKLSPSRTVRVKKPKKEKSKQVKGR